MRTNIAIDADLMKEVMELTGHKTRRETVETALRLLATTKRREQQVLPGKGGGRLDRFRGAAWRGASDELAKSRQEWGR